MVAGHKPLKFSRGTWVCTPASVGTLSIDLSPAAKLEGRSGAFGLPGRPTATLTDVSYVESQIGTHNCTWRATSGGTTGHLVFTIDASGRSITGRMTRDGAAAETLFHGQLDATTAVLQRSNVWFGVGLTTLAPTPETGVVQKTVEGILYSADRHENYFTLHGTGLGHGFHGGLGSVSAAFYLVASLYDPQRFRNVIWAGSEWGVFIPAAKGAKLLLKARKYAELIGKVQTLITLYKAGARAMDRADWASMREQIIQLVLDSEIEMNSLHPAFECTDVGVDLVALSYVYVSTNIEARGIHFAGD